MIRVATVLRSGGDYTPEWVWALRRRLNEHLPEHEFVCLTDVSAIPPSNAVPLKHRWPGWWSKMEVFRLEGPVLYMDLDTLPVGDLSDLAAWRGDLALIWDLNGQRKRMQSGVMAFTGPHSLYETFAANAENHMRRFRGDGEWLNAHAPDAVKLQDLFPGQIVSYKWQAKRGPPEGARLVCGHGNPRFSSPKAGWAHELWAS